MSLDGFAMARSFFFFCICYFAFKKKRKRHPCIRFDWRQQTCFFLCVFEGGFFYSFLVLFTCLSLLFFTFHASLMGVYTSLGILLIQYSEFLSLRPNQWANGRILLFNQTFYFLFFAKRSKCDADFVGHEGHVFIIWKKKKEILPR